MLGNDDSDKVALERRLQELKLEVEKTGQKLKHLKVTESIVEFLNKDEKLKARFKALFGAYDPDQISQPLAIKLFWDAENRRFIRGELQNGLQTPQTGQTDVGMRPGTNKAKRRRGWNHFAEKPPQEEEYFVPILQALRHFDWSATPERLTPLVLEKMRPRLSEADFERIPSGMFIRWECRMRFARKRMKDQRPPLLNPNSARGLWEATEAGRRYLEEMDNHEQ